MIIPVIHLKLLRKAVHCQFPKKKYFNSESPLSEDDGDFTLFRTIYKEIKRYDEKNDYNNRRTDEGLKQCNPVK